MKVKPFRGSGSSTLENHRNVCGLSKKKRRIIGRKIIRRSGEQGSSILSRHSVGKLRGGSVPLSGSRADGGRHCCGSPGSSAGVFFAFRAFSSTIPRAARTAPPATKITPWITSSFPVGDIPSTYTLVKEVG